MIFCIIARNFLYFFGSTSWQIVAGEVVTRLKFAIYICQFLASLRQGVIMGVQFRGELKFFGDIFKVSRTLRRLPFTIFTMARERRFFSTVSKL